MIGFGVVGYGYWGPNLVRNISEAQGAKLLAICDLSAERLQAVHGRYPSVGLTTDYTALLSDPAINAVVIATPVSTHFPLARQALLAGKHVLVEKPITSSASDARELIELAEKRERILMVDHTFAYSGAVRKIQQLVSSGELGDVYYFDSVRVNLGLFQHDVNVIWDLAVHDLAILDYVFAPRRPVALSATGVSHTASQLENIAYLTLFFEDSFIAHINVNWLTPVKIRRTLIGGSRKMVVFDDLEPSEKVKVYDKGIVISDDPASVYKLMVGYRTGDMWAPQIDSTEALREEVRHFIECVQEKSQPVTDGYAGLRVVEQLEAASLSMKQWGRLVELHDQAGPAS